MTGAEMVRRFRSAQFYLKERKAAELTFRAAYPV